MDKNKIGIFLLIIGLIIGFIVGWLVFSGAINSTGNAKAIINDTTNVGDAAGNGSKCGAKGTCLAENTCSEGINTTPCETYACTCTLRTK